MWTDELQIDSLAVHAGRDDLPGLGCTRCRSTCRRPTRCPASKLAGRGMRWWRPGASPRTPSPHTTPHSAATDLTTCTRRSPSYAPIAAIPSFSSPPPL